MSYIRNLIKKEGSYHINQNYISQNGLKVNGKMRAIILDWMMELSNFFRIKRETYYLTMNYLDRYLMTLNGSSQLNLQLAGLKCFHMASKMDEVFPLKQAHCLRAADFKYSAKQF